MKIAFVASSHPEAQKSLATLKERYAFVSIEQADIIIALGGDGFMLHVLQSTINRNVSVFGMNFGSVGFLMNSYCPLNLEDRLTKAKVVQLHPLHRSEEHTSELQSLMRK